MNAAFNEENTKPATLPAGAVAAALGWKPNFCGSSSKTWLFEAQRMVETWEKWGKLGKQWGQRGKTWGKLGKNSVWCWICMNLMWTMRLMVHFIINNGIYIYIYIYHGISNEIHNRNIMGYHGSITNNMIYGLWSSIPCHWNSNIPNDMDWWPSPSLTNKPRSVALMLWHFEHIRVIQWF